MPHIYDMIAIDFSPGSHGHFLSFVVNQYIFDVQLSSTDIFQSSGAAHAINVDAEFLQRQIVCHGHYSYFEHDYPDDADAVIWIKHDPRLDFVLLTNIYHRCHPTAVQGIDVNPHDIKKLHNDMMFLGGDQLHLLRNNWYAKLQENHLKNSIVVRDSSLPRFDFDYAAFFDLTSFLLELRRCADFCGMKLHFGPALVDLYHKFLDINQGYQKWCLGNQLINDVLTNKNSPIDANDWQLQAFLNYQISRLFKIYDGRLFAEDPYPDHTQKIRKIILDFLQRYDLSF